VDYSASPAYLYVDGRGQFVRFAKAAGNGIGICRILPGKQYEIIPFEGAEAGFAIGGAAANALDKDEKDLGPAETRLARGLTYVMPVRGAFSYLLTSAPAPAVQLQCDRDLVVAGERVIVRGKQDHPFGIPSDAKPGQRIWEQFEGAWIDFTVVPLADVQVALDGNFLALALTGNLAKPSDAQLWVEGVPVAVALRPGRPTPARINLGEPRRESVDFLAMELRAGDLKQTVECCLRTTLGTPRLAKLPDKYTTGMHVRGKAETNDFGETRGYVNPQQTTCGDKTKDGLFMHPPWVNAVGYTFAQYEPVKLPEQPAAFRASVGKADGSDPGDGILYRVGITGKAGEETIAAQVSVTEHEWALIEADLSRWADDTVRIKLISDVGENDNSSGDWACWADMRIETLNRTLTRELVSDPERYRHIPGPYRIDNLTAADLRSAKAGWLHYDGIGLAGQGDKYESSAVLNGILLGNMAPAGGNEVERVFAENVSVPLTPEAIKTLGSRNVFALKNPNQDWFAVRRFWLELELADGRKCSSDISTAEYVQAPEWPYGRGIGVPQGEDITVEIWFGVKG
jgi:hypothetical protein